MERLTAKFDNKRIMDETFNGYYDNAKNVSDESRKAILDKLGKLEDLEEKIGMPLEDFYKCITHNNEFYYVIDENEESILEIREVYINDGYMHNYCSDVENRNGYFYFDGEDENYCEHNTPFNLYGETMFLTREDAEKKLEELKNGK